MGYPERKCTPIYQNGMKVKDICDKYSIGHTTLNNYLRRFNIPRHT